jgi:2-keto-4-pentenoate hydratase/2-oxohepta-3-ene-1,7-dioic acid hydratase in catechol pathway
LNICRFRTGNQTRWGVVRKNGYEELVPHPFGRFSLTGRIWPKRAAKLCAPCAPTKIVAIGVNYADHAREFDKKPGKEPLIFLKPPSAVIGPEETIRRPPVSRRVDYEGELAIVIGRRASNVRPAEARRFVLGYTT